MIGQYVASVPLQTQSWLVAVSPLFSSEFFLLQYSSLLVLLAALVISIFSIRRGADLYLTAIFITLAFFLLSKKVIGYYYVMLLPFALIELLPLGRFRLLVVAIVATAWISLSPYFASWANQSHWLVYAALGALNSLLWLAMLVWLWRESPLLVKSKVPEAKWRGEGQGEVVFISALAFLSVTFFLEAVGASLLQPLVNNPTSPIRAPLIPNGLEANAAFAFALMLALTLIAFVTVTFFVQRFSFNAVVPRWAFVLACMFPPLYFLTFTLTKESTTALELGLRLLGL
jgi:hypothetical protein